MLNLLYPAILKCRTLNLNAITIPHIFGTRTHVEESKSGIISLRFRSIQCLHLRAEDNCSWSWIYIEYFNYIHLHLKYPHTRFYICICNIYAHSRVEMQGPVSCIMGFVGPQPCLAMDTSILPCSCHDGQIAG